MTQLGKLIITLGLALTAGACTTLSDKDRAVLESASQNAADANQASTQAVMTSQQALAAAQAAEASAASAAADAKTASDKADLIFQHGLRKP